MILTLEIVGHQSGLPGFSGSKQFGPNGGTIGRLPDNDWVLPDPYISGRHALIRYVGGKFYIEDISTNGVFLNAPDNRLQRSRPQLLEEGDRLYIDEYEIGVRLVNEVPAAPPQPSPQVQLQQRPFSPVASTLAVPVMMPQPAPRPQPPPIARSQAQPQPQSMGLGVPPATMQMPVARAPVQPPPSVEPIVAARPSTPVPPPPTRPQSRRVTGPDNDPLRLLGLDDRRQAPPPAPAPIARVPDLLEMSRPNAINPAGSPPSSLGYQRNADLVSGSSLGFPSPNDASLNPCPIPDPNEQDDLSLAPLREALSVAAAPPSLPPPLAPSTEPLPSMAAGRRMNGGNGNRPGTNSATNMGTKLGAPELARKASNGSADATLAYPPGAQNGTASRTAAGSIIIPDDYDPLEDDVGINVTSGSTNAFAVPPAVPSPPTNGAYTNGRMTMAQPPAEPPRRPAAAPQPAPPSRSDMVPPLSSRAGNSLPRVPSPPIMASSPQQAVPQMAPQAPQNVPMAPQRQLAKTPTPLMAQPSTLASPPPPPSIPMPMPMPGPAVRSPAVPSAPAGVPSRPMSGAAPRTEEPSRPMIPPPSIPRPARPAVVPYPGRKPSAPATASSMSAPQAQPSAASVPTTVSAPPAPRTQAVVAPPSPADSVAIATLLEAAGLQASDVTPEFSGNLGRILRVAVTGMIEVLRAQQSIKDEFRMRMTAFKNVDNNPLKLSGTPEEALQSLFAGQNGSQLRPVEAFEDAFREVRNHELAMLDGMRVAYEFMLSEFDPDRVQEDFNSSSGRGSILGKSAKSRYWDFYREKYGEIISDGEASFRNRFGDEFAKAYEEQLERLNALDRNRGK